MNYFRRLEPTPTALRNGRRTLVVVAAIVGLILVLLLFLPGFRDTGMVAITATTMVALVGHAIAYLGQPTLTRYRLGLIVATVGIVASFVLLIADPFPAAS